MLTETQRATTASQSWFIDIFRVSHTVSKLFDILLWLVIALSDPPPTFTTTHFSSQKGSSLHQTASFDLLCAKIGSQVWAVALLKNKTPNKKVTGPVNVAQRWRLDRSLGPNQIWQGW